MGLRGPAAQPTALRILRGKSGASTPNPHEPKPAPMKPKVKPPDYLNDDGKKEWKRNVEILAKMRVLTEADYTILGQWCMSFQILLSAQKDYAASGNLYKTNSGYVQQNPLLGILVRQQELQLKYAAQFGFTPAARVRLQAEPEPPAENEFLALRRG